MTHAHLGAVGVTVGPLGPAGPALCESRTAERLTGRPACALVCVCESAANQSRLSALRGTEEHNEPVMDWWPGENP